MEDTEPHTSHIPFSLVLEPTGHSSQKRRTTTIEMGLGPVPSIFLCDLCGLTRGGNGADGNRTHDPRLAKPVLSQLSYRPKKTAANLTGRPPISEASRASAVVLEKPLGGFTVVPVKGDPMQVLLVWLRRIIEIGILEFLRKLGWKWLGGLVLGVVALVAIVIVLILVIVALLL